MRDYLPTLTSRRALLLASAFALAIFFVVVAMMADPGLFTVVVLLVVVITVLARRLQHRRSLRDQGALAIFSMAAPLVLFDDRITTPDGDFALTQSVRADVETSGNLVVTQRLTATRMLTLGVFSLAAPKKSKVDARSLYVILEGEDFQSVVEINPKRETAARKFAAQVNTQAKRSRTAPRPLVASIS